ncbi:glycosyltransferase family 39 protein [Candidatus Daviesbacteria bacterium]|nr:glycosyltransferase family 39 protein [Candidatus Daviesbacteria bacterium]
MVKLHRFKINKVILAIFFWFLISRIWGINFGLPFIYHPDEGKLIYSAFYAASNFLKPDTYLHPILLSYLLIPVFFIQYILGLILGIYHSPFSFYVAYLSDPTIFIILGRIFSLLVSLGCASLVLVIGNRFFGQKTALTALFLLSSSFLFTKESHYIKEETLSSLFLLVTFYFVLKVFETVKERKRSLIFLGISLGLAVSTKIIYFPISLIVLLLYFFKKINIKELIGVLVLSILAYIATNPYIILDSQRFIQSNIDLVLKHRMIGPSLNYQPVWFGYIKDQLFPAFGLSSSFIYLLALITSISGKLGKKAFIASFSVLTIFLGIILAGGNFPRWAVAMIPFLSLTSAVFLWRIVKNFYLILIIIILISSNNLIRTLKFDFLISQPDTRTISKNWIEKNIPANSKIVVEGAVGDSVPSFEGPPLVLSKFRLLALYNQAQSLGLPAQNLLATLEVSQDKVGYDLIGVPTLDQTSNQKIVDTDSYQVQGVEYLIVSSWAHRDNQGFDKTFLSSLNKNYLLVNQFTPTFVFDNDPHGWRVDYQALDKVKFLKDIQFGPVISIYQLKQEEK